MPTPRWAFAQTNPEPIAQQSKLNDRCAFAARTRGRVWESMHAAHGTLSREAGH